MKKKELMVLGILFSSFIQNQVFATTMRTLNYEEARFEGGFNSTSLYDVLELASSNKFLNQDEITDLVNSKTLINLKILDLSNQPYINDDIIGRIVDNPTFSKVLTLKLNGTAVTDQSIERIVNSIHLGSIRDLPQISGMYDIPSSEIRVYTKDTQIKDTQQKAKFDFHIEYKPFNTRNSYPWEPVDYGVKIVSIETY